MSTADVTHKVTNTGFQARSRGGKWSWTLMLAQKRSGAGLQKLDFFRFRLFLNSSATDIVLVTLPSTAVETAVVQCTSRCVMARGHRLNTSIVLAVVHGLSGLFRTVSAVEPSLFRPLRPLNPSLISYLASVDIKQNGRAVPARGMKTREHLPVTCCGSTRGHWRAMGVARC